MTGTCMPWLDWGSRSLVVLCLPTGQVKQLQVPAFPTMANFSRSSCNIELHDEILYAKCETSSGEYRETTLNLDQYIGNHYGKFAWEGRNYSMSASHTRLEGTVLHARLYTSDGGWHEESVDLEERIANICGYLACMDQSLDRTMTREESGIMSYHTGPEFMNQMARQERDANEGAAIEARRALLARTISDKPLFKHEPLCSERNFRLLRIASPGEDADIVECSIIEVDMATCPKFAALSYTWGSPFPPTAPKVEDTYQKNVRIRCNGRPLEIGQNLYEALRRLRGKVPEEPQDRTASTALMKAAWNNVLVEVEKLLREGADIHARDGESRTALHHAARMAHVDIVKALVLAGSDMDATDEWGDTPIELARKEARNSHQPQWRDTERFLSQRMGAVYGKNTVLRPKVTELEYFWIDAICINQADDSEKALQVAQMGEIFQAAEHVIIWLGREFHDRHDNTEEILQGSWRLEFAREADQIPPDVLQDLVKDPVAGLVVSQSSKIRLAAVDWLNTNGQERIDNWMLGVPLFQRAWFNRAWILQEVFMAKDLTVVCGPYLLPWDLFVFLSIIVEACRLVSLDGSFGYMFGIKRDLCATGYARAAYLSGKPHLSEIPAISLHRQRMAFKREGRLSMMPALNLSRHQQCADARDKVYAVLDFASIQYPTTRGPRSIVPDYTRSARDLFLEVGKSLLAMHGPSALSLSGKSKHERRKGLPSWLPDLDNLTPVSIRGIDTNALHDTQVQILDAKFDQEDGSLYTSTVRITPQNELLVRAYIWDTVSETADTGLNDVGADLSGLRRWLKLVFKLELSSEQRRRALWRTLIEDATATTPDGPLPYGLTDESFKGWLTFVCISAALGHHENFPITRRSAQDYDKYYHEKTNRPEPLIKAIIKETECHLAALGLPWSRGDARLRNDLDLYSSNNSASHALCSLAIYSAMPFVYFVGRNDTSRRVLRTETHNVLGTGSELVQAGDAICIVDGASVPYLIRPTTEGKYELIGEAYLYSVDTMPIQRRDAGM
ncbi:hypothetical protein C7974DRAFT_471838 [Boeremia exigua]|uniref:uncharacterized protein n=1 Tax=Boeremia exigua TaxID=749465 RepID=UPI001E8EABD6|nr:uncharacterized protein C7974DRAFT_471838 [Boeremia exigua]KAH6633778.1 hypothetical protein C7974DRAFT_471838 [Boeremia exigua]